MNSQMNTFNQTSLSNNTSATQCQARKWGTGSGYDQCSRDACFNGLCNQHANQEAKCCVPCTTIEDGKKRIGLFMGRINQWQDNIVGILPFKDENNVVRIIGWASPETFDAIIDQVANGLATLPPKGQLGSDWNNKVAKALATLDYLAQTSPSSDSENSETISSSVESSDSEESSEEESVGSSDQTSYSNLEWKWSCLDELDKFTDGQKQIKSAKFLQSIIRNKLNQGIGWSVPIATC